MVTLLIDNNRLLIYTYTRHSLRSAGYFFSMISDNQYYVASPGDSVAMECNFHADGYDMFEHPVIWRKQQLNESLEINILGTIIEPFAATNRFEVAFNSVGTRYQLELSIKGCRCRVIAIVVNTFITICSFETGRYSLFSVRITRMNNLICHRASD